ncbi:FAX1 [Scenedesmus sp. PABB004]|nr:FAX1 [Scenedesmus sp. PABB004]
MSALLAARLSPAAGAARRPAPAAARPLHAPAGMRAQQQQRPARGAALRAAASGDGHAGHAKLHDFCMTIPYGGLALLSGVLAMALKASGVGLLLLGAGALISAASVLSLRSWKGGGGSAPYTLACAGTAGWVAHQMWLRVSASVAPVPSGILLALSAALAAFCVYNVAAGGNPPPARKPAA